MRMTQILNVPPAILRLAVRPYPPSPILCDIDLALGMAREAAALSAKDRLWEAGLDAISKAKL